MNELDAIMLKITKELNELADLLASGSAIDHAHYRYQCGVIFGLDWVKREIEDLNKLREEDDAD